VLEGVSRNAVSTGVHKTGPIWQLGRISQSQFANPGRWVAQMSGRGAGCSHPAEKSAAGFAGTSIPVREKVSGLRRLTPSFAVLPIAPIRRQPGKLPLGRSRQANPSFLSNPSLVMIQRKVIGRRSDLWVIP
jgi:hypothetical protein